MSKIVVALRKASERYDSQNVTNPRDQPFMEPFLKQMNKMSRWKNSWVIWTFALGAISAGLMIFTSQAYEESQFLGEGLMRPEMISQTTKPDVALQAQVIPLIEDDNNLQAFAQSSVASNRPSQEQLTPNKNQDLLSVYTIQVGSFQNFNNMETTLNRLREMMYSTVAVAKVLRDKVTWYRVYVGEFQDKNQAQDDLIKLKQEYTGSFVIKTKIGHDSIWKP
jgi:cell division septation protein DedD